MDLQGFHFANPDWLLGLAFLPLAAIAVFFISRAKHSTLFLGNPRIVEMSPGFFSFQLVPWILRFLVLSLCLIAAARPQAGQKKVEEKKPVTDLFVALDLSSSMLTTDLAPNRVTAAKKILSQFLDKVENVRVGVIIFARIAFTQCPLTSDLNVVKQLLTNVDVFSVKLDGTAIGDALVACLNRLDKGSGKNTDNSDSPSLMSKIFKATPTPGENVPNSQAIILLTDGGDNASHINPLVAAKIAASRGVKIYAIGVGSLKREMASYLLPNGKVQYPVDPRTGYIAMSDPVDMVLLKEIARITGAKAYSATDNHSLQEILDEIAKLEKRDVSVTTHWEYQELASYFLLTAFLILALDIVLETTVWRTLP
jgi:Ca-activated chloride channel homolog